MTKRKEYGAHSNQVMKSWDNKTAILVKPRHGSSKFDNWRIEWLMEHHCGSQYLSHIFRSGNLILLFLPKNDSSCVKLLNGYFISEKIGRSILGLINLRHSVVILKATISRTHCVFRQVGSNFSITFKRC